MPLMEGVMSGSLSRLPSAGSIAAEPHFPGYAPRAQETQEYERVLAD